MTGAAIGSFLIGVIGYGSAIALAAVAAFGVGILFRGFRDIEGEDIASIASVLSTLLALALASASLTRWLLS